MDCLSLAYFDRPGCIKKNIEVDHARVDWKAPTQEMLNYARDDALFHLVLAKFMLKSIKLSPASRCTL